MALAFRCDNSSRLGSNLCFNGGSCINNDTFCACPQGFFRDDTIFHTANCVLDNTWLPVVFAIVTVITIIAIAMTYSVIGELKYTVKVLLQVITAHSFFCWLVVLAVLIESGQYAAANVLLLIAQLLLFRATFLIIELITLPLYAVLRRPTTLWMFALRSTELTFGALQASALLWAATESYNSHTGMYNLAITLFLFILGCSQVAMFCLGVFQARRLTLMVRQSQTDLVSKNLKAVLYQLDEIIKAGPVMIPLFSVFFVFPIVFLTLGSFPYQVMLLAVMHICAPLVHCRIAYVLKNKSLIISSSNMVMNQSRDSSALVGIARSGSKILVVIPNDKIDTVQSGTN